MNLHGKKFYTAMHFFFCKTLERKEIVSIINIRYLNYFNTLYLILDYAEMNTTVHFMGWYREVCHE